VKIAEIMLMQVTSKRQHQKDGEESFTTWNSIFVGPASPTNSGTTEQYKGISFLMK
jgi:hypothetical protein